ncbi:MAG: adenylate/guanylate cyclase domain-containing protein [Alphaproteobacteria bacterium]
MGDGRRVTDPNEFLDALADRLRQGGVAVTRITTGVPILHPNLWSFSGLWELGKGSSERRYRLTGNDNVSGFENSPIRIVYDGGGPVRCGPQQPAENGEFSILADLRQAGFTDYIVLGARFSDGTTKAVSLATDHPDRFGEDDIALFEAMMPALAMNLEVQALRRTARTLLDTYVGRQAGERVLNGAIMRGMGETIRAVIWLCDLRGFTELSESLARDHLIELLNQYFGAMTDAVEGDGGEVLKFIGDAMLAIFPIDASADAEDACSRALSAAIRAKAAMVEINRARSEAGQPVIGYGIALHLGDVEYGNIGGESRLDFTVIGPAVNFAARIEGLCGQLGRTLLLSDEYLLRKELINCRVPNMSKIEPHFT